MRHCLTISLLLLAGCGAEPPPALSLLDLRPCPGWEGPRPQSERQFARAAAAERAGRACANARLAAVRDLAG